MTDADTPSSADPLAPLETLFRSPACSLLRQLSRGKALHVVGGAVRDVLLGESFSDLDIVVDGWGLELAEELAERHGARAIALGGDRFAAYRVATPDIQFDIWDRRGLSIEADLARRDLTLHSFAVDLASQEVIDPFHGLVDLAARCLRMTTDKAFVDDPLRVLRLGRLVAQLEGFAVDPATLASARSSVSDLRRIAKERLRVEIQLTLECRNVDAAIALWLELGVLPEIVPGIAISKLRRDDLRQHLTAAFDRVTGIRTELPARVDYAAVHLAVILVIVDRLGLLPAIDSAARLAEGGLITKALDRRLRRLTGSLDIPADVPRQRWWIHRLGRHWVNAVALAAALDRSGSPEMLPEPLQALVELVDREAERLFDPPWLLDGNDLIDHLGLEPGIGLGRLLERVRRRQIEDGIEDRQQALTLAAHLAGDRHLA